MRTFIFILLALLASVSAEAQCSQDRQFRDDVYNSIEEPQTPDSMITAWTSIYSTLTYDERVYCRKLLDKDAPVAVLYFWYNLTHGVYDNLPEQVLQKDRDDMMTKYPSFALVIVDWYSTYAQTSSRKGSD